MFLCIVSCVALQCYGSNSGSCIFFLLLFLSDILYPKGTFPALLSTQSPPTTCLLPEIHSSSKLTGFLNLRTSKVIFYSYSFSITFLRKGFNQLHICIKTGAGLPLGGLPFLLQGTKNNSNSRLVSKFPILHHIT